MTDTATKSKTLADLLPVAVDKYGASDAFKYKTATGEWKTTSYTEVLDEVRNLAIGLADLGVKHGDRVAMLGSTRPEWTLFDFAAMSAGAAVVPIYQTNSPTECKYVIEHSGAKFVIVEDESQLEKIREIRDDLPELEEVVMMIGSSSDSISMEEIAERGKKGELATFEARITEVSPGDICKIVYTSGTTGPPKGCVISHGNYRAMLDMAEQVDILGPGETTYLFLPLAHVFALLIQYGSLDIGGCIAYWERDQLRIVPNLAEVKPDNFPSVPRIFEKVYDVATSGVTKEGGVKKVIFDWAIGVGAKVAKLREEGREPGFLLSKQYGLADKLVLHKIREIFGGRLKLALTGAAPIDPRIIEFFHAAGVPVYEAWGMTETSTGGTANMPGASKVGSVGRALPGVELKLSDQGELLARGPNIFQGYYKNEEATAETIRDGWLHTGDIATIDEDGYVSITGRIKEIIITAGGKNITPVNIEVDVKRHHLVSQCVVIGDRRPYLVALVTLDEEALSEFAAERGLLDQVDTLYESDEIRQELEAHIEEVNQHLARVEQIKKFVVLPKDLSQEGGELTPTLKLKRPVIAEKYDAEIEELYSS